MNINIFTINLILDLILFTTIIIIICQRRRGNKIIKEISKRDAERQKAIDDFIKEREERTEMLDTYIEKVNETGHKLLNDTIQLSKQKELLVNRLKELGVTDFTFLNTESDKA